MRMRATCSMTRAPILIRCSRIVAKARLAYCPTALPAHAVSVYKAFTYLRHQVRQFDRIITLDVSLHDFIYFAVQIPSFGLLHSPPPLEHGDCIAIAGRCPIPTRSMH
jgi:hypothetical protein